MLHKNHNYIIEDSLFADNNINVDVDRTDGVLVRRTIIIGETESYRYAAFCLYAERSTIHTPHAHCCFSTLSPLLLGSSWNDKTSSASAAKIAG